MKASDVQPREGLKDRFDFIIFIFEMVFSYVIVKRERELPMTIQWGQGHEVYMIL